MPRRELIYFILFVIEHGTLFVPSIYFIDSALSEYVLKFSDGDV